MLIGDDVMAAGNDLPPDDPRRASATAALQRLLGVPYLWGGRDPARGLDCSGAVAYAWEQAGLLPLGAGKRLTAQALWDRTTHVPLSAGLPGDLVFYGRGPSDVTHVMLLLDNGLAIGASGGGRATTTVEIARQQGAKVQIRPATYRRDVVGVGRARVGLPGKLAAPPFPVAAVVLGGAAAVGVAAIAAWAYARRR